MPVECPVSDSRALTGPAPKSARDRLPATTGQVLGCDLGWARGRRELPAPECSTCNGRGRIEVKPGMWKPCPSCRPAK